jgi:osmotically-inducible protein OsmY
MNGVQKHPPADPESMRRKILHRLARDHNVAASVIDVQVDNERIILTGLVTSYAQRKAAELDARLSSGYTKIENRIIVQHEAGTLVPSDDELKSYVERAFSLKPGLDKGKIFVSVLSGVVTLEGAVASYWQKIKAEELAAEAYGIIGINNLLAVVPTENIRDETIAADIVTALDRNFDIDASQIDVTVEDGRVTLSGLVPDRLTYHLAFNTALYTIGVTEVINKLTLSGD